MCALPQVRILIPMIKWRNYIRLVIEKCQGHIPTTDSLQLDEEHDQIVRAKTEWNERHARRIEANDGQRVHFAELILL